MTQGTLEHEAPTASTANSSVGTAVERSCRLCGGVLSNLSTRPPALVECRACTSISLARFPEPSELVALYQEDYYSAESGARFLGPFEWAIRQLRLLRVRATERRQPGGRRILDVGCGRGELLELFQSRGWTTVGTQVSQTAAEAARRRRGVTVLCGELPDLPFEEGTFDVITYFHVLEHLPNPGTYLEATRRLLVRDGLLVVEVPDCSGFVFRKAPHRNLCLDYPHHLHFFGPRSLRALLERHGFRVEGAEHFSLEYSPFTCLQNLLNLIPGSTNRLYRALMRNATARELRKQPWTWIHGALAGLLAPVALCLASLACLWPPGNTLRFYCRKMEST